MQTVLLMWGASQRDIEMAAKILSQVCVCQSVPAYMHSCKAFTSISSSQTLLCKTGMAERWIMGLGLQHCRLAEHWQESSWSRGTSSSTPLVAGHPGRRCIC